MRDLLKKGLALGVGLAVVSKEQIEKTVEEFVKKGEISVEDSRTLVKELIEKAEQEKNILNNKIKEQFKHLLKEFQVPLQEDMERLEQRIIILEEKLEEKKHNENNE